MPEIRKPRSGSLAFQPRKRSKRIYPRISHWKEGDKTQILGFAGYKAGMIQVSMTDNRKGTASQGEEIIVPATVLECPPLIVVGVRFYKQNEDGLYSSSEIWDGKASKEKNLKRKVKQNNNKKFKEIEKELEDIVSVRVITRTQPNNSGLGKKTPEIFELEISGKDASDKFNYVKELLGKEVKLNDIFKEGEYVDVVGVTKGKGWQGPVKRFGLKIRTRKDHGKRRHVGTMGSETPRMIKWTVPQAGQMGFFRRTEYNKRILKIGEKSEEVNPKSGFRNYGVIKGNYMIIEGSVPGSRKRLLLMRKGLRTENKQSVPVEVKEIIR